MIKGILIVKSIIFLYIYKFIYVNYPYIILVYHRLKNVDLLFFSMIDQF